MKLLLDQDIYAITARYLRALGHDVLTAADLESSRVSDETLLLMAQEQGRIFVTRGIGCCRLIPKRICNMPSSWWSQGGIGSEDLQHRVRLLYYAHASG
jgi:uncharacterized protein with PIN domain